MRIGVIDVEKAKRKSLQTMHSQTRTTQILQLNFTTETRVCQDVNNDDPRIGALLDRWITEQPPYEEDDNYVPFGGYEFIGVCKNG